MNLLSIIDHIHFSFIHKWNQKTRFEKSNFVFENKIIADTKVPLQITSKKKFDFKKLNKNFKSKNHAYVADEKEKDVNY